MGDSSDAVANNCYREMTNPPVGRGHVPALNPRRADGAWLPADTVILPSRG